MQIAKILILALACLLMACQAKITLPLDRKLINVSGTSAEIVCKVRQVASDNGLSFHYGTADRSFGIMNTFRLIGDGFEITMVNDVQLAEYDLRLYVDESLTPAERALAQESFSTIQQFVTGPMPKVCLKA